MLYVSTIADLTTLLAVPEPLVVGCYADWCPASSMAKSVFEKVASSAAPTRFCKVRTDMSPDVATLLRVDVIPSFFLLMGRQIFAVLKGAVPEDVLVSWLNEGISKLNGKVPG